MGISLVAFEWCVARHGPTEGIDTVAPRTAQVVQACQILLDDGPISTAGTLMVLAAVGTPEGCGTIVR